MSAATEALQREWSARWPGVDHGLSYMEPAVQPVKRVSITIVLEPEGRRFHVEVVDAMYLRRATPEETSQALCEAGLEGWEP